MCAISTGWLKIVPDRDLATNPYHISICFIKDLRNGWYTWKRRRVHDLWAKYAAEVQYDFTVDWWWRGGTLHLSKDDEVSKAIYDLWSTGGYGWKSGLHISL